MTNYVLLICAWKFDYSYRDAIGGGELTGVDGFELKLLIL